ncbi:MAG: LemA family protein [Candidatus Hydrothermales bacterium]
MVYSLIILIASFLLLFLFIGIYNKIIKLKLRVENAWSQIDVQLKRRHDLIPNLVNAVRGYMKYEQETLQKIIDARSKAVRALETNDLRKIQEAERELGGLLTRLIALFENYPELKANENVLKLQEELTHTENRIAFARQHFNDSVMIYNTYIQVFPQNIIASIFKFKTFDFFIIEEKDKEVPRVSLEF